MKQTKQFAVTSALGTFARPHKTYKNISMSLIEVKSLIEFSSCLQKSGKLVVAHFWASWAPQCQQMTDVMTELAKDPNNTEIQFLKVEAEAVPEVSQKYSIAAVPTCVLFKNGVEVARVNGANVPELTSKVKEYSSSSAAGDTAPVSSGQDLNARLKGLINTAPVMVFMKGSPEEPRCGFSRQLVQILKDQNVKYSSFNILADEEVRQGLKTYSNWPTYPQLYGNGELIGGLDIVKELVASGEFQSQLPQQESLDDRLKSLIGRDRVMVFMKGSPDAPRCGFSRTLSTILKETGVKYSHFDILTDEEVRQGLKTFSNWPTYPQIYVNNELIGGLDIVKELKESGDLESTLQEGQ